MKILFQGGWKENRDPESARDIITAYCESLAEYIVAYNHQIILSSNRSYDQVIANRIITIAREQKKNIKDHLLFFLPSRIKEIPSEGKVKVFETRWWMEERTYLVQETDAVIAIGGGRGTFDCVEKAYLSGKPVFVVGKIHSSATNAWNRRKPYYKFINDGDADFQDDLNATPTEFFDNVFRILNSLSETRYSRRIFIVHGHDHHFKDSLVNLLKNLNSTLSFCKMNQAIA